MAAAVTSADAQLASTTNTSSLHIGKRKRNDAAANDSIQLSASRGDSIYDVLPDVLQALESAHSLTSTILSRQIPTSSPLAKRSKRSPNSSHETSSVSIKSQIDSQAYQTFEELAHDFDKAIDAVLEEQASSKGPEGSQTFSASTTDSARALQREIHSLLGTQSENTNVSRNALSAAFRETDTGDKTVEASGPPSGRSVLTLFGTGVPGQQPRQYFASPREGSGASDLSNLDPAITASLPNGIFTTSILPSKSATRSQAKTGRTLKDVLPFVPPSLPNKPPTAPSSRATRSQLVEWYKPSTEPPKTRPGAKDIYAEQSLTHGTWISYCSHTDIDESVNEKQVKRNRALSGGDGPDEDELEFLQQQRNSRARAKKSSLFRGAFSSFGPSRDDSTAGVPAETRSQIWWNKFGRNAYDSYVDQTNDLLVPTAMDSAADHTERIEASALEKQSQEFEEAVEAFSKQAEAAEAAVKRSTDEDEMLEEITDAIEALLMYQQDRHKSVPSSGRPGASLQPSAMELTIYETMKAQLTLIISQLPPYAVARLNGEKLGKLSVSTAIPIPVLPSSGILEEPERPTVPVAASGQSRPPLAAQQSSASRMGYQQGASTPPTRPIPQQPRSAAATTATQYGNRTQTPAQYGYSSQTVQQPQRTHQYAAQQAQGSSAINGYRQQLQNGYQQYGQYTAQSTGSPAARPPHPNQYTNRPQQNYQPRPSTYQAPTAQIVSAGAGRSASPQNANAHSLMQQRPGHGAVQGHSVSGQNGQYTGNHMRPSSGNSAPSSQGAFAIGGVKFNDEELAQIEQRRQMQNSPQTPTGQRPPSANGVGAA